MGSAPALDFTLPRRRYTPSPPGFPPTQEPGPEELDARARLWLDLAMTWEMEGRMDLAAGALASAHRTQDRADTERLWLGARAGLDSAPRLVRPGTYYFPKEAGSGK